jgi:hypothetical protein
MPVFQYERSLDTKMCFLSFSLDWIQSLIRNHWLLITEPNIKKYSFILTDSNLNFLYMCSLSKNVTI